MYRIGHLVRTCKKDEQRNEYKQQEHVQLERMFLRGEFSGKELSGQMARPTNQLPECLEELGIPDKGIVQVFQELGMKISKKTDRRL